MITKILITGSSGFIGKHVVSELQEAGFSVFQSGRDKKHQNETNKYIHLDLNNPEEIISIKDFHHFDVIIHLGARIGWTGETLSDMYVPNVLSTGCLSYLARRWKAQMIFTSSISIHGVKCEKIDINTPINPNTAYGKSKWLAEELIDTSGVDHCILRLAGVFGNNGPNHLGLNRAISNAMNGISPTIIGSGQALRNYIYVKDVARIITHIVDNKITGTHLVAGSQILSINQMINDICHVFLPGRYPDYISGEKSSDQIVNSSLLLPSARNFNQALYDIKKEADN